MKILTFLLLLIAFLRLDSFSQIANKQKYEVKLYFDNPQKEMFFLFYDEFGEPIHLPFEDSVTIESGESRFYFELEFNKRYQVLLLNAGEKIRFKLVDNYFIPIKVSKKKEMELRFFEVFRKTVEKDIPRDEGWIFQRALLDPKYIADPELRTKMFALRNDRNMEFLREYTVKNDLSEQFYNLWKSYFSFKMNEAYTYLGNKHFLFPISYRKSLLELKDSLIQEDFLFSRQGQRTILNFLDLALKEKYGDKKVSFNDRIEIVKANFTGKTREWLKLRQFIYGMSEQSEKEFKRDEIDKHLVAFYQEVKNENYKEFLKGLEKTKKIGLNNEQFLVLDKTDKVLDLKEQIKNAKLTYVDLWASWCGPCISEIKNSSKIKQDFDSTDVQFVFVSIDKNSYYWKKASQRLKLKNSFLDGYDSISSYFKVKSIPRYIIFDNYGQILSQDALRPSDPKLKPLLNKYLQNY